ncbi:MAG TPA: hypothetical protein PKV43_00680 [Armatimonadota bacterium]|nr:hypothetical protein [Armatimonadota bacterium]
MSNERRQILEMLAQGKINTDEAERLLDAMRERNAGGAEQATTVTRPRFFRVFVKGEDEQVDIRVPLQLIRAGVKLGALIPPEAQAKISGKLEEKGIQFDLSNIKPETLEELIDGLSGVSIDVKDEEETVRVFCE